MALLNPPGWLENAGATHTAQQMRSYMGMLVGGLKVTSALRTRPGVHPSLGGKLFVQQTGTPSMAVDVLSGGIALVGEESTTQGTYFAFNDSTVTLSVTTAHATLPRIDIVQMRVRDQFYSGANNDVVLEVKAGTPASSPVAPTPDVNSLILAEIAVGAGVTSITDPNITDKRIFMAALGGVIKSLTEAEAPSVVDEGQLWWANDVNKLKIYDGATNYNVWQTNWTSYNPVLTGTGTNPVLGTGGSSTGAYLQIGKTIYDRGFIIWGTGGSGGSGFLEINWPITPTSLANSSAGYVGTAHVLDNGALHYPGTIVSGSTTVRRIGITGGSSGQLAATLPFAIGANGDRISWSMVYGVP